MNFVLNKEKNKLFVKAVTLKDVMSGSFGREDFSFENSQHVTVPDFQRHLVFEKYNVEGKINTIWKQPICFDENDELKLTNENSKMSDMSIMTFCITKRGDNPFENTDIAVGEGQHRIVSAGYLNCCALAIICDDEMIFKEVRKLMTCSDGKARFYYSEDTFPVENVGFTAVYDLFNKHDSSENSEEFERVKKLATKKNAIAQTFLEYYSQLKAKFEGIPEEDREKRGRLYLAQLLSTPLVIKERTYSQMTIDFANENHENIPANSTSLAKALALKNSKGVPIYKDKMKEFVLALCDLTEKSIDEFQIFFEEVGCSMAIFDNIPGYADRPTVLSGHRCQYDYGTNIEKLYSQCCHMYGDENAFKKLISSIERLTKDIKVLKTLSVSKERLFNLNANPDLEGLYLCCKCVEVTTNYASSTEKNLYPKLLSTRELNSVCVHVANMRLRFAIFPHLAGFDKQMESKCLHFVFGNKDENSAGFMENANRESFSSEWCDYWEKKMSNDEDLFNIHTTNKHAIPNDELVRTRLCAVAGETGYIDWYSKKMQSAIKQISELQMTGRVGDNRVNFSIEHFISQCDKNNKRIVPRELLDKLNANNGCFGLLFYIPEDLNNYFGAQDIQTKRYIVLHPEEFDNDKASLYNAICAIRPCLEYILNTKAEDFRVKDACIARYDAVKHWFKL